MLEKGTLYLCRVRQPTPSSTKRPEIERRDSFVGKLVVPVLLQRGLKEGIFRCRGRETEGNRGKKRGKEGENSSRPLSKTNPSLAFGCLVFVAG